MKIRLFEHPLAPVAPREFEADSLGEWLLSHYGEAPDVWIQVYEGEPSEGTELRDAESILRSRAPVCTVLQSPGAPAVPFIAKALAMMLVSAIVSMLAAPRKPPANVNRAQQSPNNALAARENQVRLQERVEDIYGTVKSIPSLMMPAYNKYIQHRRVEYGYYCIGRGYYDVSDLQDADSLISAIDGAAASVYEPFTSPNSGHAPVLQIGDPIIDDLLTVRRSVEVDGLTLLAQNQTQLQPGEQYTYTPDAGGDIITQKRKAPNFNVVAEAGQQITISMASTEIVRAATGDVTVEAELGRISVSSGGPAFFAGLQVGDDVQFVGLSPANSAPRRVVSLDPEGHGLGNVIEVARGGLEDQVAVSGVSIKFGANYDGVRTIQSVADGAITLVGATFTRTVVAVASTLTVDNNKTDWSNWITLPASDRTEIWCNIVAGQGMYKDDGGRIPTSVSYTMEIEKLDPDTHAPTGLVETSSSTLSGVTTDERAETIEHVTGWVGPARVRMRRTTPYDFDFAGVVVDEIKWVDLYSVSPIGATHFGNKTTIHTVTLATQRATSIRNRQLNCIVTRKLPIFNGSTFSGAFDAQGRHVSGTIAPTDRMVDILAAVCVDPKIGARDLATEVDMAQIWGVQQALDAWNPECSRFSYTFDSDELSFEETVQVVANAAFCVAYRQSGKIRLALDRPQAASAALFTHRNKRPARDKAETITRSFPTAAEYDGVEFVYIDEDSNVAESFTLPLSGATKAKKFEIPGIRSFTQAWLRAQREYAKLIGQRVSIETEVTTDARLLLPYTRVDIVDNTRFKSYDGEVVGQNGMELVLSQPVQFTSGSHSIVLMRRDGSLQSIPCMPGSDENRVVLQQLPSEAVVTEFGADGVRTIYSFAADSARASQAFLVHEIGVRDGQFIKITGVNYSADYYAADNAPIPPKASILS